MSTPTFSWNEHEAPDRAYYLTRQISSGPYSYRTHTHIGQTELIVVVRGRLEHVLGGRLFVLPPGQAQLVRQDDAHSLRGRDLEFFNLAFPTPSASGPGAFWVTFDPQRQRALAEPPFLPPFSFETLGLGAALDVLPGLCDRYDPWGFLRLQAGVYEVLSRREGAEVRDLGGYVFTEGPLEDRIPRTLASLPRWMTDLTARLAQAESLPTAAELPTWAGVSASHLSRSFRRAWGLSPSGYLNRLRLDRAALRLRREPEAIGEVARREGFAEGSYFAKLFRARFGVTPGEYARGNR